MYFTVNDEGQTLVFETGNSFLNMKAVEAFGEMVFGWGKGWVWEGKDIGPYINEKRKKLTKNDEEILAGVKFWGWRKEASTDWKTWIRVCQAKLAHSTAPWVVFFDFKTSKYLVVQAGDYGVGEGDVYLIKLPEKFKTGRSLKYKKYFWGTYFYRAVNKCLFDMGEVITYDEVLQARKEEGAMKEQPAPPASPPKEVRTAECVLCGRNCLTNYIEVSGQLKGYFVKGAFNYSGQSYMCGNCLLANMGLGVGKNSLTEKLGSYLDKEGNLKRLGPVGMRKFWKELRGEVMGALEGAVAGREGEIAGLQKLILALPETNALAVKSLREDKAGLIKQIQEMSVNFQAKQKAYEAVVTEKQKDTDNYLKEIKKLSSENDKLVKENVRKDQVLALESRKIRCTKCEALAPFNQVNRSDGNFVCHHCLS